MRARTFFPIELSVVFDLGAFPIGSFCCLRIEAFNELPTQKHLFGTTNF